MVSGQIVPSSPRYFRGESTCFAVFHKLRGNVVKKSLALLRNRKKYNYREDVMLD